LRRRRAFHLDAQNVGQLLLKERQTLRVVDELVAAGDQAGMGARVRQPQLLARAGRNIPEEILGEVRIGRFQRPLHKDPVDLKTGCFEQGHLVASEERPGVHVMLHQLAPDHDIADLDLGRHPARHPDEDHQVDFVLFNEARGSHGRGDFAHPGLSQHHVLAVQATQAIAPAGHDVLARGRKVRFQQVDFLGHRRQHAYSHAITDRAGAVR
jgi:hypothetical protein